MSNDDIVVHKRRSWSAIPDDILEDLRLNPRSRVLIGWMVGRPRDWKIQVGYMLKALGISEYEWRSSRAELQHCGYYRQTRTRQSNGSFAWKKEVFDPPLPPSLRNSQMVDTIRGSVVDEKLAHESVMDEFLEDIPPPSKQDHLPPPTSSKKLRSKVSAPQQVVVDLDELVEAAYWQAMKADKAIKNPSAWRASVRKRIQENGPSAEDLLCLDQWRAFLKAIERRQAEEVEKAAKTAQPVTDREVARERASNLSRSFGRSASRRTNPDNGESTANQPQDDGETPS
jgi:hypothetical protein